MGERPSELKSAEKKFTCSPSHPQVNFNTHQLIIEAIHADNSSTTGFAALDGKGRHPKKIINFFKEKVLNYGWVGVKSPKLVKIRARGLYYFQNSSFP